MKKNLGFTLIELLVVISIISLLSSIVLVSLQSARLKAADSKVVQERHQIEIAIQLLYADTGYYPDPGDTTEHCLADVGCLWAGVAKNKSIPNELAFNSVEVNEKAHPFIKTTFAAFGGRIDKISSNPIATYGGNSYQGPFYKCTDRTGGKCNSAVLIWTLNNDSCPSGYRLFNGNQKICMTNAAGLGGSTSSY